MKRPIKQSSLQKNKPEVFIIESLTVEDEVENRFEGRILSNILRLCLKKPAYYYCRSEEEFRQCVKLFQASGYRYLHLSLHGSDESIFTTLDEIPFSVLSEIFDGVLKKRRLFVSACNVGTGFLSELIRSKNKGMYSIASPMDKIRFDRAAAIWAAFYVRMFDENSDGMVSRVVKDILSNLASLFLVRFRLSFYVPKKDKWIEHIVPPKAPKIFNK